MVVLHEDEKTHSHPSQGLKDVCEREERRVHTLLQDRNCSDTGISLGGGGKGVGGQLCLRDGSGMGRLCCGYEPLGMKKSF